MAKSALFIKTIRNHFPTTTPTTTPTPTPTTTTQSKFPNMRDWSKLPEAARNHRGQPITAPDDAAKVVFTWGRLHTAARVKKTFETVGSPAKIKAML